MPVLIIAATTSEVALVRPSWRGVCGFGLASILRSRATPVAGS